MNLFHIHHDGSDIEPDEHHDAVTPGFKSGLFLLSLAGIIVVSNFFLLNSVRLKKQRAEQLTQQIDVSKMRLARAKEDRQTGMMAASIRNEFAGWRKAGSTSIDLLNFLAHPPYGLKVESIRIQRPLLQRPLNSETNSFFRNALATAGSASVHLRDSGDAKGKFVAPKFADEAGSQFETVFSISYPQKETGEPKEYEHNEWILSADFPLALLWHDVAIAYDQPENKAEAENE